jgi:hypothetical protein
MLKFRDQLNKNLKLGGLASGRNFDISFPAKAVKGELN